MDSLNSTILLFFLFFALCFSLLYKVHKSLQEKISTQINVTIRFVYNPFEHQHCKITEPSRRMVCKDIPLSSLFPSLRLSLSLTHIQHKKQFLDALQKKQLTTNRRSCFPVIIDYDLMQIHCTKFETTT